MRLKGTFASSAIYVRSEVANRGDGRANKRSRVGYLLCKKSQARRGRRPPALAGAPPRALRLRPGRRHQGGIAAMVPRRTKPGIYRVIACVDVNERVRESNERNNCKVLRHRIAIQHAPSGFGQEEVKVSPGSKPPIKEYFPTPERVKEHGVCPASTHGQGFPAANLPFLEKCHRVWVDTLQLGSDIHECLSRGTVGEPLGRQGSEISMACEAREIKITPEADVRL